MPSFAQFVALLPEFSSLSESTFNAWLANATPFFNQTRWAYLLTLGVCYWIAHSITLATANSVQPMTDDTSMQKAGDVSYQRDSKLVNAEAANPYMRTTYGQQYYSYAKMVGAGATALCKLVLKKNALFLSVRLLAVGSSDSGLQRRDGMEVEWVSAQKPTITPSVRVSWSGPGPNGTHNCCHFNITEGEILFHGDCTHELKGQKIPLPDATQEFIERVATGSYS